jgi:N-acetylglutamate synthase-like GNAT family acetyltransferase
MYNVKIATTEAQFLAILQLRYKMLRQPWNQPIETATDNLEQRSINAFIEDEHGMAIACGRLQENEHKTGQIRFMAVDSAYQGKGLGKKILAALEEQARMIQLANLELQARENAVVFYKSCGYFIKETSFLLWGQIQHYLMEKVLD